jgi:hypothetical protein
VSAGARSLAADAASASLQLPPPVGPRLRCRRRAEPRPAWRHHRVDPRPFLRSAVRDRCSQFALAPKLSRRLLQQLVDGCRQR